MKCKDLEELLSAYADGELPRTQKEFIEEHLAGCTDCRAILADLITAGRQLSSLGAMPATPDIRETTISKIKATNVLPGNVFRRWLRLVMAIGTVVIVLAVLLVAQPWSFRTPAASASTIVRNSPEVQAFFDGEKIEDVEVTTKVVGTEGDVLVVLVKTETRTVAAEVDLEKKIVTDIIRVHVPELTALDAQKAIDIAKTDPRVQELLAKGGVFGKPSLEHAVSIKETTAPNGQVIKEGSVEVIGQVTIESGGKKWLATVDLDSEKVLGLAKPSAAILVADWSQIIFSIINPLMLLLGILIIIGLALRNKVAEAVAGVVSIVLGILTLYGGLYAWPVGQGDQLFALIVPVLGLVIGITDIRRRATRRWMPVTGIILCSLALAWDSFNIIAYPYRQTGVTIALILVLLGIITYASYNQIRKIPRKWLRAALVLATAAIVLTLAIIQPWSVNPQGIITRAYAATESLQSYRTSSSIVSTNKGETSTQSSEWEYATPDRRHGKLNLGSGVFEFIIIGDKQYVQPSDNTSGDMHLLSVSGSSISKEDTLRVLDSLNRIQKLPDVSINGVDCLHLWGEFDMKRLIEKAKADLDQTQPIYRDLVKSLEEQMTTAEEEVELWIGKDDYLIRQIKRDWQAPSGDGGLDTFSSTVKYYDFNEPIVIEPPLDASGNLLPGWFMLEASGSPSLVRTTRFNAKVNPAVTGDDPAHQQVNVSVIITNVGTETARNVSVCVYNNIDPVVTSGVKRNENFIDAVPATPGTINLKPGESETYLASWESDTSNISGDSLIELLKQTIIYIEYMTPEGADGGQYISGGAPYPSAIPPANPPGK